MPEFYPSIGDAAGAAMQHNIRLAYGPDRPPRDRHLPNASAGPHSIPGMIARLTEDATPDEVAEIIDGVIDALVGTRPQLTELVAAADDWTRVRLAFDDPHHHPAFETWTRLAAAHVLLQDAQQQMEVAKDGVAACPAEHTDPRYHKAVNVLRTRELLDDVLGADAVVQPASTRDPEADRQRAALASSPQAGPQRPSSPTSLPAAAPRPVCGPLRHPSPLNVPARSPRRTEPVSCTRAERAPPPHARTPKELPCLPRVPARRRPPPAPTRSSTFCSASSAPP